MGSLAPASEPVAITPRGKLRPGGHPDSHELDSLGESSETDLVGREALTRSLEALLAFFDRLPMKMERDQIPPGATPTHNPETALLRIECDPSAGGKVLQAPTPSQLAVAE